MCVWMLCTGGLLRYAPAYTFFLKGCTPPKQAKRSSRLALFSVLDDDDGRPDDDLLSGLFLLFRRLLSPQFLSFLLLLFHCLQFRLPPQFLFLLSHCFQLLFLLPSLVAAVPHVAAVRLASAIPLSLLDHVISGLAERGHRRGS